MSTNESTALWSATPCTSEEVTISSAGLSVRQRKLLSLLAQPVSVQQLATQMALPDAEVQLTLERFAKLGLAKSDVPEPFNPMLARATPAPSPSANASRTPLFAGIAVTALALIGAGAWLTRGGSGSAAPQTSAATTAPQVTSTAPAVAAGDEADAGSSRASALGANAKNAAAAKNVTPAAAAVATTAAITATAAAAAAAKSATPPGNAPAGNAPAVAAKAAPLPTAAATPAPSAAATVPAAPTTPATTAAAGAAVTAAPSVAAAPPAQAPTPAPVAAPTVVAATPSVVTAPAATPAAARPVTPAPREIKLLTRVEPAFPRGVDADRGNVRARLQVDATGAVTSVEILEAVPPRVFDRVVRTALQQWRYEPTGAPFSAAAEISFAR